MRARVELELGVGVDVSLLASQRFGGSASCTLQPTHFTPSTEPNLYGASGPNLYANFGRRVPSWACRGFFFTRDGFPVIPPGNGSYCGSGSSAGAGTTGDGSLSCPRPAPLLLANGLMCPGQPSALRRRTFEARTPNPKKCAAASPVVVKLRIYQTSLPYPEMHRIY